MKNVFDLCNPIALENGSTDPVKAGSHDGDW
jgi:hypothetical protein